MATIYEQVVPVAQNRFNTLSDMLTKAEEYAQERGFDPNVLLDSRLYPDMLPLTKQIQIATDMARLGIGRLASRDMGKVDDNETTIAQLKDRLLHVQRQLTGIDETDMAGAENKPIELPMRNGQSLHFKNGQDYVTNFLLPNLYFHTATAYNILRNNGVPLGKKDFLGSMNAEIKSA